MVTGAVSITDYPAKALPGTDVKIICNVAWAGASLLGEDMFTFIIDEDDPTTCLKGEKWYTTIAAIPRSSGNKDTDITFSMPDKDILNFYLELWTEIPDKYAGKCTIEDFV